MRQPTAALAVAVICVSIVGCASTIGNAESPTTTPRAGHRLVSASWPVCCSTREEVNVALATAEMAVTNQQTSMSDNSATMAPQETRAIDSAAEAPLYADSGRAEAIKA